MALRIGFGGSSCSGKSTITCLLSRILPRCKVLMQDQFFKREELIPSAMDGATRDWDCPEAIEMDRFKAALRSDFNSDLPDQDKDKLNGRIVDSDTSSLLPASIDEIESMHPSISTDHEIEALRSLSERLQTEFCSTPVVLVDGFLLYQDDEILDLLDVKFFLEADRDICRQRRSERKGYSTADGSFWVDPPGYFDHVVWPNYLKYNRQILTLTEGGPSVSSIHKLDSSNVSVLSLLEHIVSLLIKYKKK